MRMWMVNPRMLCDPHLLGEHNECHKFLGSLKHKKRIDGFVHGNMFEAQSLLSRHDALAEEMTSRGMNHKSPLEDPTPYLQEYPEYVRTSVVNVDAAREELTSRCDICRERFLRHG